MASSTEIRAGKAYVELGLRDNALQRTTALAQVAKGRIKALSDAHQRRVWRDWRPATQARIKWEADHVLEMFCSAFAPIADLADVPAAASDA